MKIIRSLIFYGGDLAVRGKDGKTSLDLAVDAGHNDAAKLLKEVITHRFRSMRFQLNVQ